MQKQSIEFEYFHGYESEQFAFYRVPKVLFTNPYFRELSSDAKILYGLMLDRMALSIRNHWIDEEDRVYIIFTLEQIMEYLNCGKDKGVKILAELDSEKGIGLIERVKQGLGRPTLIYVKSFIIKEAMESEQSPDDQEPAVQNCRQIEGEEAEVKTSVFQTQIILIIIRLSIVKLILSIYLIGDMIENRWGWMRLMCIRTLSNPILSMIC